MSTRKGKRPGTIEPPRGVINVTREKVVIESNIKNKHYKKTMIITTFACENSITIYIGNYDIYCIDVQLLKNRESGIVDTGILTKARWDISCSINEPFTKGVDTTIIIKLMLQYIHDRYPQVKYITFTDMSTKECEDGSSVNLAAMKLLTDGKTWYETHFDAKIDPMLKDGYVNMRKYAETVKNNMSFDVFIGNLPQNTYSYITKDELRKLYDNAQSWQEFFYPVRKNIGFDKFCIWLGVNNWFNLFVQTVLKLNIMMSLQFILTPKQYDIKYTVVKNMSGSGHRRITLKHRQR